MKKKNKTHFICLFQIKFQLIIFECGFEKFVLMNHQMILNQLLHSSLLFFSHIKSIFFFSINKIHNFYLQPGDHIEKLNNINVVGKRHYEVARLLKDIPTHSTFTLRLIEPMKSGFQGIGPRNGSKGSSGKKGYGSGKETLRFKANGNAAVEEQVRHTKMTHSKMSLNNLFLDFLTYTLYPSATARRIDTNGHR